MQTLSRVLLSCVPLVVLACQRDRPSHPQPGNSVSQNAPIQDTAGYRRVADSLFTKGERFKSLAAKDSSLYYHTKALTIREDIQKNDLSLAESYRRVAALEFDINQFETADKHYEKARAIAEQINAPVGVMIPLYLALARCKVEMNDLPTASSMGQYVLRLVEQHQPQNLEMRARCYKLFSVIDYYKGQYDNAIDDCSKAMFFFTKAGMDKQVDSLHFNIALIYLKQQKYLLTMRNLDITIANNIQWSGPSSKFLADLFLEKGYTYQKLGLFDSAALYFKKTLAIRQKIFGEKHVNTFGARYTLGLFFEELGKYESALQYYQTSIISLVRDFNNADWETNPKPQTMEANPDLFLVLTAKASALKKMTEKDSLNDHVLSISLNTYLLADSVLNVYRRNAIYDDPQLALKESYHVPYEAMMEVDFALYRHTRKEIYLDHALKIMEHSRAALLQDALQGAEAFSKTGLSAVYKEKENQLFRTRSALLLELSKTNLSPSGLDSLNKELIRANNEQRSLLDQLAKENPNYFFIKYAEMAPNYSQVMKLMRERNETYLEYLWGHHKIFIMQIDGESVRLRVVPRTTEFDQSFSMFLAELSSGGEAVYDRKHFDRYCKSAYRLYQFLIGADLSKSGSNHLIISADGPLASFPFDALITREPGATEVDYHLAYLLHDYSISYVQSAGLLKMQTSIARKGNKLLAFGYAGDGVPSVRRDGLQDLPGTREEVAAIKEVMQNGTNHYYLGEDASETTFKKQIGQFNLAHLALHGVGDTVNALQSRLIFRSDKDSTEDGQLYAHELYDLNLEQLDLAVLSACESGVGKQQAGEGVLNIARGFAYAGCPSMVISLWKLDDKTSAKVMSSFYKHLSEAEPIDQALKQAKLDYLASAKEFKSHPSYWAAFLPVGETRPLAIKKPNVWRWVLGFGIVILIVSLFLGSYRRRGRRYR